MARTRVHHPVLREQIIFLYQHHDAFNVNSNARRTLRTYLLDHDATWWLAEVRRGRFGPGAYRLEGRRDGTSRRVLWTRVVSTDPRVRAPAPVVYGSAATVVAAAARTAPANDVSLRQQLAALAAQVGAHEKFFGDLVSVIREQTAMIKTLESRFDELESKQRGREQAEQMIRDSRFAAPRR